MRDVESREAVQQSLQILSRLSHYNWQMERPFVFINVAMTADGKIDTVARKGAPISSERDKERVDQLRAESDAVMVGGRTLLDEDPKLTVKLETLRKDRVAR